MDRRTLITILIVIAVGILAFVAGTHVSRFRGQWGKRFMGRPGMYGNSSKRLGAGMGRNMINGQITNISGNTITIKLPNGLTQTVTISPSTQYLQTSPAAESNLKQGETISVFGVSPNSSTAAREIQINTTQ